MALRRRRFSEGEKEESSLASTRSDVGESDPKDPNSATVAAAQSFKRACAAWGLGRYLYSLPQVWAEFDNARKQFTPAGLKVLRASLNGKPAPVALPVASEVRERIIARSASA